MSPKICNNVKQNDHYFLLYYTINLQNQKGFISFSLLLVLTPVNITFPVTVYGRVREAKDGRQTLLPLVCHRRVGWGREGESWNIRYTSVVQED